MIGLCPFKVSEGEHVVHRTRLQVSPPTHTIQYTMVTSVSTISTLLVTKQMSSNQFVQEAVLQCVQRLSEQQPDIRVGLITFNYQVHDCNSLICSAW